MALSPIIVVDSGTGNFGSILNMFAKIGVKAELTADPDKVAAATRLVLPGVGTFHNCMAKLRERGLVDALNATVISKRVPVLGICVGLQVMMAHGEEGDVAGLNWFAGKAQRFSFSDGAGQKVPHMGWNYIVNSPACKVFKGFDESARFYFLHSFHVAPSDPADVAATADYGYPFPSALWRDNIYGVQFHPEKSHRYGMQLFSNFAALA